MKLINATAMIAVASAADYSDMYTNKDNWGQTAGWEGCDTAAQSPIDLKDTFKKVYSQNDMQFSNYNKGWNSAQKSWDKKHALQVNANRVQPIGSTTNPSMGFTSKYGASLGFTALWNPLQFHVHHPSEHTINGQIYDLEVHMVHLPAADRTTAQNDASFGTALTMIFDTTKFDASVADVKATSDAFFNKWVSINKNQNLDLGTVVGDLLAQVDFNDRWSYEGSLTTPPCTKLAFFNVARKVYPVSAAVLKSIKDKMKTEESKFFDTWSGNNRNPQKLDGQNPVIIVNGVDPEANADKEAASRSQTLFIVFLVLFFLALLGFIVVCTMLCRAQSENSKGETEMVGQASVEGEVKANNE